MKCRAALLAISFGCFGLTSCGDKAPTGQVVAKVGKDEITALDLKAEMQGFRTSDPKVRKLAEQQALQQIIQRKLLAAQAHKDKLDKTPEFARQRERMEEALLVQTWQGQLVNAVPAPSLDETQQFVSRHPDLYSARKKFQIRGLRFNAPNDPTLVTALQPLKTLEEIVQVLNARKIPFQPGNGEIDALAVDPRFVEQLMKLPPNEVFVVPQGNMALVGQIVAVKVEPVANQVAVQHASRYLRSTRVQESVRRRFGSVVAAGMKDVEYNKAYEPPKPPAKGDKPPAPAGRQ